jgi:glycosyltransferase involved in cell wall biosynthesis
MKPARPSILIVSESYWPTIDGGALFEHRLSHGLRIRGWRVHVWAPSPTGKFWIQGDRGVITIRESSRKLRTNPRYRISIHPFINTAAVFRLARPHVVHIHNFGLLGLEALRYARSHEVPVVVTNHNVPQNWTANLFRGPSPRTDSILASCLSHLLNLAYVVVSPSNTANEYLSRTGVTTKQVVISNGVDTSFFHPSNDKRAMLPKEDSPRLVHVGRLDREKSCDVLVTAVAQASLHRRLTLAIVGEGVERPKLERQARRLEAAGRCRPGVIRFLGPVSEPTKRRILQSSDLFVTASQVELQGIAVLESMACEVAALGPAAGALPELCQPGKTGLLFEAGRADDCSRQLCDVDQDALRSMGVCSRSLILNKHDAQLTYEKYDCLLRQVRLS